MPLVNLENVNPTKLISHSSLNLAHKCPRKFEIYRLNLGAKEGGTVHTAFGHSVGSGIQALFMTNNFLPEALLQAFLAWEVDLFMEDTKSKKSFATACMAIESYSNIFMSGLLEEGWEMAYFNGKPACELSFIIELPNGYYYRGYVDIVLVNKNLKKFKVVELKTTNSATVVSAQYKNSFQGVGYGVVLDKVASDLGYDSDYMVDYVVYKTKSQEFLQFPFYKTSYQRVRWLNQLLVETRILDLYEQEGLYPMHGESCFDFFRQCNYFGTCEQPNEWLKVNMEAMSNKTKSEFADSFLEGFDPSTLGFEDTTRNTPIDNTPVSSYTAPSSEEFFDFFIPFQELVENQKKWLESSRDSDIDIGITSGLDITWED